MSKKESPKWCTIESDPGVFTELIELLGVTGLQVEELPYLDAELLKHETVFGIIFLFRYREEKQEAQIDKSPPENLFFAKQVVTDACATQAILSVLLNIPPNQVSLGDTLSSFKTFCQSISPYDRGVELANVEVIRNAHNSFAPQSSFILDEEKPKLSQKGDAYHFVAYVPFQGTLFELDGLKRGPINHGSFSDDLDFKKKVVDVVLKRIATYSQDDSFVVMSIIASRKHRFQNRITELESKQKQQGKLDENEEMELVDLKMKLRDEDDKIKDWKTENARRRHNYVPFLVNFLKILAKKQELGPLIDKAKQQQSTKTK